MAILARREPGVPLSLEDARRLVDNYVTRYNTVRLHSAIGYVTPKDKLEGREAEIFAERDRKLAESRERRKARRATLRAQVPGAESRPAAADAGLPSSEAEVAESQAA